MREFLNKGKVNDDFELNKESSVNLDLNYKQKNFSKNDEDEILDMVRKSIGNIALTPSKPQESLKTQPDAQKQPSQNAVFL